MSTEVIAGEIIVKQPYEEFIVRMDFTNLLKYGDTIASASVIITPNDHTLFLNNITIVDGLYVDMLALSGTYGTKYKVSIQTVTTSGYKYEGDGILKVL